MTQNFVRYSPDVEQMEPDFEQRLQTVLDAMKLHMRGSRDATARARRPSGGRISGQHCVAVARAARP